MWNWVNGRCPIIAITNAVNLHYWQDHRVQQLNGADGSAYRRLKRQMKEELFEIVAKQTSKQLDPDVLTIVWARRFTEYKRPGLIFMDEPRVKKLLEEKQVQLIFAGKFHPKDTGGRELFNMVLEKSQQLPGIAVMTGYELELSGYLKRGSDIWLNTPLRPLEASGTSGMSANMNASIHVSIYDGWAVEGTYHRHNGFIINEAGSEDYLPVEDRHRQDYDAMMDMLENELIPMYYNDPYRWAEVMRRSVQSASAYFHSDRMAVEYFTRLYKPVFL
jgi:starch phosphorylase